jgi:hypothetical protein
MGIDTDLKERIEALYTAFRIYNTGGEFCTFCYSQDEIETIMSTPARELSKELSGKLLRETGDHWPNSEVYRHYLPRILEVMAPPTYEEDLYPEHLFETMKYNQFSQWPIRERELVMEYLEILTPLLKFDKEDIEEWLRGMKNIDTPNKRLN